MITRTDGETSRQLGAAECVKCQQASRIYTQNGACLMQMEDRIGSLEPGKFADVVVLSDNYLSIPEAGIRQIKPVLTMVGGKVVHELAAQAGSRLRADQG